jgi:hypothetical protein
VISVTIFNGNHLQAAPALKIESGPGVVILPESTLISATGNAAPLLIAGFLFTFLRQSNASASARNELHLQFSCNADLPVVNPVLAPSGNKTSTRITLTGLGGISTPSTSQLALNGSVASVIQSVTEQVNLSTEVFSELVLSDNTSSNQSNASNHTTAIISHNVTTSMRRTVNKTQMLPLFSPFALWNASQQSLIFAIERDLTADVRYELHVTVTNRCLYETRNCRHS